MAKKPKKNPWSDDESSQSDNEMEDEEEVAAPRERVGRRAKGGAAQSPQPLSLLIYYGYKTMVILSHRYCEVQYV